MHTLLFVLATVFASDPPPPAAVTATGVTLDIGSGLVKITGEEAALRAVRAMAANKFQFAEVCEDGTIRGYSETLSALVVMGRLDAGTRAIAVFVAGWDKTEAQRVRISIGDDIMKGPATDEKAVRTFGTALPTFFRKAPRLELFTQEPVAIAPIMKHFAAAAAIAMEKSGVESRILNPGLVGGIHPWKTSVLTNMPTGKAQICAVLCVTASPRTDIAASHSKALVESVIKILYE